jgi:hypothetical protein
MSEPTKNKAAMTTANNMKIIIRSPLQHGPPHVQHGPPHAAKCGC